LLFFWSDGNVLLVMNTNTLPRKASTRPSGFFCPSFLNATEQGGGGVGDGVGVDDGGGNVDVDMSVSDSRREGERERRRAPLARAIVAQQGGRSAPACRKTSWPNRQVKTAGP
jgi:hypothetical protein